MDYCIETIELTRVFERVTAVDHLTMRVPRGSFFGFLGPNGAGKSTTIRILTGMLLPTSGQALVLGMDVVRHPIEIKRRIGVAPEDSALFENLTALEYLGFVGRIHGLPGSVIRARIDELLALTALEKAAEVPVFEYSQGMRKKLAL
ncbi:MAG TPA: ABC transporter ATP-binding protein, partial [Candidatus Hydrogenedentes bacterium]|nr:ABC transporter ATP-binding protein [Candidatus Hydrogenedentota bacterium]